MDSTASPILNILPVDILSYLVEQIIDDEESLKALSHTNRALRLLSLPRLRSHTVILDISTGLKGQTTLDPVFKTISDFNQEKNFRIPSLVRVLEIRDRWAEQHSRLHTPQRTIKEFVDALHTFLGKCIGLRKFLRDGYEHYEFKTTDLIREVLKLPKLKVLCLKIHQDRQWWFNETPKFEEYECADTLSKETGGRGLACLSIALPMTLDRPWWDEVWDLCRNILIDNTHTLKHLYFDGPDLEVIVDGMAENSLADIRLLSLRFRMGFGSEKFLEVLGLTQPTDEMNLSELQEDAATYLRRIEFQDPQSIAHGGATEVGGGSTSDDILPYMRTPNIKRLQVFGESRMFTYTNGMVERVESPTLIHLSTYPGLQHAELQSSVARTWNEERLSSLASIHGRTLRTLMLHQVSVASYYRVDNDPGAFGGFSALRRLEILQDRTSFFWSIDALWNIINTKNTISEVQITMRHSPTGISHRLFRPSIGGHNSFPRRILTPIYSTAFYLHNRRNKIDTSQYLSRSGELFPSTRVITSYRQMLGDSSTDQLAISSYMGHMLHTKRLSGEQQLFPAPRGQTSGPELQNEAVAFSAFVDGIPECLKLFQLQYIQKTGADPCEMISRHGDAWRKVDGEWVYEKVLTELLPW
ncbi:hypothetical protein TWF718_009234 [Orbilia javanica]|uniref:Uncharacterized protein n=1 Tax=Orbilia javanica TaxID=47235 RepID=A0AAN8RGV8_9PEZI